MPFAHANQSYSILFPSADHGIGRLLGPLVLWLVICVPATGETVYLNDSGQFPTIHGGFQTSILGDDVTLAGTSRILTEISFGFRGNFLDHGFDGDEFVQVTLYENDGPSGEPGTAFFESDLVQITSPDSTVGPQIFGDRVVLPLPNVLAPDSFTWAVQRFGMTNATDMVGLFLGGSPSVGSSEDFLWLSHTPGKWIRATGIQFNYDAEILAIPEPATISLFAVGFVGLYTRTRRVR